MQVRGFAFYFRWFHARISEFLRRITSLPVVRALPHLWPSPPVPPANTRSCLLCFLRPDRRAGAGTGRHSQVGRSSTVYSMRFNFAVQNLHVRPRQRKRKIYPLTPVKTHPSKLTNNRHKGIKTVGTTVIPLFQQHVAIWKILNLPKQNC